MDDFKAPSLPVTNAAKKPTNEELKKDIAMPQKIPLHAQENPYKIPSWSKNPPESVKYKFEIQKNGQLIEEVEDLQKKAFWSFGRSEKNDIKLDHFSISRFHAILQYRRNNEDENTETDKKQPDQGWYIYDLNSTHGTYLNNNKQRIPSGVYIRMRVGYILRFGGSTRWFILDGPEEDQEPEISFAEMREQRQKKIENSLPQKHPNDNVSSDGISWGMQEDADEEPAEDLSHNPYASTNNEELFLNDPKKTLRGFFEREGLTLEYKCDEMSIGSFVCRVELPIDDIKGKPIVAEVVHKGKKKECVVQCALEACRILDRHGVLRQANQEPLRRRLQKKDSDSDDDEFWDRTGDIERRKKRKETSNTNQTLTYDDLIAKESELLVEAENIDKDILQYQKSTKSSAGAEDREQEDGDDLDSFMANLSEDKTQLDKIEIKKLRVKQLQIKQELEKVKRLIKITKPVDFSFMMTNKQAEVSEDNKSTTKKVQLPMIGKRKQFSKFRVAKLPKKSSNNSKSDEEEMDDDGNNNDSDKDKESKKEEIPDDHKSEDSNKSTKPSEKNEVEEETHSKKEERKIAIHPTPAPPPRLLPEANDDSVSESVADERVKITDSEAEKKLEIPKTRQPRNRIRNRQKDASYATGEDPEESTEKYSKWVPPQNQSGDGMTSLNDKYGY